MIIATLAACGDNVELPIDGATDAAVDAFRPDGRGAIDGALVLEVDDAGALLGCLPGPTECSNCVDDDRDGRFDGFDPGCSSAFDDREGSFTSGAPGDHQEAPILDCFFDGNSNPADDGCRIHACCLLSSCPATLMPFDRARDCSLAARCRLTCEPATVQGCDCFGCCRMRGAGGQLHTVMTHPAIAPACTEATLADSALCPPCTPSPTCGRPCDPAACRLCPGQTAADLPASCAATWSCPAAQAACAFADQCPPGQSCASGCCTPAFE